jgi:hypothetical protein
MRLTVGASSRLESEMKSRKTKPQMKKTQTGEITSLVRPGAICGSGFTTCPTPLLIGCWKNTNTSWPFQQDFRAPSNRVAALVARFELRAWARIVESGLILGAAFINHQHYRSALVFAGSLD